MGIAIKRKANIESCLLKAKIEASSAAKQAKQHFIPQIISRPALECLKIVNIV